jgi:hypothetical protein
LPPALVGWLQKGQQKALAEFQSYRKFPPALVKAARIIDKFPDFGESL